MYKLTDLEYFYLKKRDELKKETEALKHDKFVLNDVENELRQELTIKANEWIKEQLKSELSEEHQSRKNEISDRLKDLEMELELLKCPHSHSHFIGSHCEVCGNYGY